MINSNPSLETAILLGLTAGAACLTTAFYTYAVATEPEFTIIESTPERTYATYKYPASWPSLLPLKIYAVRAFSKNTIGEEIILREDKPNGEYLKIKRLSQSSGLLECGDFEITKGLNEKPAPDVICTGRYPTGL